jgi:hypothetical protein
MSMRAISCLFWAAAAASAALSLPALAGGAAAVAPPPPGKGQVVFFRPARLAGALISYDVRENGASLGKLTNGAYIVQVADPGPHAFTASTETRNTLHLEVDDGETYFIRASVQLGFIAGEPDLTPSDEATFAKAVNHMHQVYPPARIRIVDGAAISLTTK